MNTNKTLLRAASFAAQKHSGQRRKGGDAEPYINHPLDVANMLANVGEIEDIDILTAALLHDTVEDTETTAEELLELFGEKAMSIVLEVTDDKSLPKAERKRLQIEHAPHLSPEAKAVKLADKISNIRDVTNNPPADWDFRQRKEYLEWGENVVAGLRGVNEPLEKLFDELVRTGLEKIGK
jgi:guanosine-3',5'-bis(diphosphate) 3'-pyrophosphohydrolase